MSTPASAEPPVSQQPTEADRRRWRLVGGWLVIGAALVAFGSLWLPWKYFELSPNVPPDLGLPQYWDSPFTPAEGVRGSAAQELAVLFAAYALLLACGLVQLLVRGKVPRRVFASVGLTLAFIGLVVTLCVGSGFPGLNDSPYTPHLDIGWFLALVSFIVAIVGSWMAIAG